MYSIKADGTADYFYNHLSDKCGSYNSEADCYNREHTFCDSWLGAASPQRSDAHHLIPTDGYVNNRRGSYPHGKVLSVSWTSSNGSKLGSSDPATGFSGTVFEPIDEFKGDFARMYFYVATRYEDKIAGWVSNGSAGLILAGNSYPAYKSWFINLMLQWHAQDPVSEKEINRNNAIYAYQYNRNPFIDNSAYAEQIWTPQSIPVVFTSTPNSSVKIDVPYLYNVTAVASGEESITLSCIEKPAWLTFTTTGNGTATLNGTPTISDVGNHRVELRAQTTENTVSQVFYILVYSESASQEYVETFENIPSNSSTYSARSWVGDNSISWDATNARTDQTIDTRAICLGQTAGSYILSQELTNGCSQLSFKHQQKFTGSGGTITLFINDIQVGEPVSVSTNVQEATFSGISVSGNFRIKLVSNGLSRIAIDNLGWKTANENLPPSFVSVVQTPQTLYAGQTISVIAEVTNDDELPVVELIWGDSPENMTNTLSMIETEGLFVASFVAPAEYSQLSFTITATDNGGLTASSLVYTTEILPINFPVISSVEFLPLEPTNAETVLVKSAVSDEDGDALYVELLWGLSSSELSTSIDLSLVESYFEGTIPTNPVGSTVYFKVQANDGKGGVDESEIFSYTVSEGTSVENYSIGKISVYPNPASDFINVSLAHSGVSTYYVSDISGRIVLKGNINHPSAVGSINVNSISNGIYFLQVVGQQKSSVVKIVIGK
jgi:endonuclease I